MIEDIQTACVAHGMLIDAIENSRGTRLFYAAQIAHTRRWTKPRKKKVLLEPINPANEPFIRHAKRS